MYNPRMTTINLTINATSGVRKANRQAVDMIMRCLANCSPTILEGIVGGLSEPSKMPCYGYSIPAEYCKVGSSLRAVKGSACSKCYALKGRYVFPNVRAAMDRRFSSIQLGSLWVAAMSLLLKRRATNNFFRWHDSGDIQDTNHLHNICMIHDILPSLNGWLPTREYHVLDTIDRQIPNNLTVRVSAHMIGKVAPSRFTNSSMIIGKGESTPSEVSDCPAYTQEGECRDCRNCWDKEIAVIAYPIH